VISNGLADGSDDELDVTVEVSSPSSSSACPPASVPDSRAVDSAVDGGAGDVEQLGEFGGGVSSCLVELDQVGFLRRAEFGFLAS
jgi:hypothetical protein